MGVPGQAKGWMTDKLGDSEEEPRVQVRCRAGRGRWGELQAWGPGQGPPCPHLPCSIDSRTLAPSVLAQGCE